MTNNLITLTIPNDDHVALRAFGKALEEMALAHGAEPKQRGVWVDQQFNIHPTAEAALAADQIDALVKASKEGPAQIDTTAQQVESLSERKPTVPNFGTYPGQPVKLDDNVIGHIGDVELRDAMVTAHLEITSPKAASMISGTDSTGTSWDERIHSASKALNADGTWRLRRKPKDMDEAEWGTFVDEVKCELTGVTETPLEAYKTDDFVKPPVELHIDPAHEEGDTTVELTIEPPVTPPGDDFHTDAGVVTEQTVAGIPPIPVPPPVVVPPVPVADEQWDFPKLMKFLTERHGKIDVPTVNQLLAVDGLAALTDLNAHPDKIGPFVARVKAHLGE